MKHKLGKRCEAVKKEKCCFVSRPSVCHSVTCLVILSDCQAHSLSVISVDQSEEGAKAKKKRWRTVSQSRSSTSNPTGWRFCCGHSLPNAELSQLLFLVPLFAKFLSHDRPPSVCPRLTCSDDIC